MGSSLPALKSISARKLVVVQGREGGAEDALVTNGVPVVG